MEKFFFEVPSIRRKEDAIAFINEFHEHHSLPAPIDQK